jgi:hypothetical protein
MAIPAYGQSSGAQTADAQIITGAGILRGFAIQTDGTNDVTITIYDGVGATGTELIPTAFTVAAADNYGGVVNLCILARDGIYADITTAGTCSYVVYYNPLHGGY